MYTLRTLSQHVLKNSHCTCISLLTVLAILFTTSDLYAASNNKISIARNQLDKQIEKEFRASLRWIDTKLDKKHVHIRVFNGYVLLFGSIENDALKQKVNKHVTRFSGVRKIFNQLRIGESNPSWFEQQVFNTIIRSNLLTANNFDGSKIKFESYGKTVYLLGIVNEQEAEDAINLIRVIKGVDEIVTLFEYPS